MSDKKESGCRYLEEKDTLRLLVLAIKHIDHEHPDWDELIELLCKFDQSKLIGVN